MGIFTALRTRSPKLEIQSAERSTGLMAANVPAPDLALADEVLQVRLEIARLGGCAFRV